MLVSQRRKSVPVIRRGVLKRPQASPLLVLVRRQGDGVHALDAELQSLPPLGRVKVMLLQHGITALIKHAYAQVCAVIRSLSNRCRLG